MRLRFPQDKTAFLYTGGGEPIRQPWTTQLTIYADQQLTTLASIQEVDTTPITGSIIFIGDDGLIPDFLGPNNGATVVWAKPPDEAAYPLVVKLDSYIDARITALIGGAPSGLDTLGELAAAVQDLQSHFDG